MKKFRGNYVSGSGREDYLKLIDDSVAMLHPNARLPYLQMLYNRGWDSYKEGFIWGNGFWMQNSYGFAYGAIPFLSKKWRDVLQNSLDLFWTRMGDGKRIGADDGKIKDLKCLNFCAPDGSLGDCVIDDGIVYRQGDGPCELYDWFYEATACGVMLQCDILLFERDVEKMNKYIPLMRRSMEFIESARGENGLFFTGASSNLLAPSYGGSFDEETKTPGKAYLAGVSVTYGSAMRKMSDVAALAGDEALSKLCLERYERCYETLPQMLTDEGYLIKSLDADGTRHGVYGAEKHGYLDTVANVDAIVHSMVKKETRDSIYKMIASVEGVRPAGILCNNYPSIDDSMYRYIDHHDLYDEYHHKPGNWVDGGCWSTVEGRAIIAYLETGNADDAFRSADIYMKWAADYRQDQPMSQWGFNTCNPWQEENNAEDNHDTIGAPVGVMIDNFATATCLMRGLLSYIPSAEGLTLRVNLPESITDYAYGEPVRYAGADVTFRVANGGEQPVIYVNGEKTDVRYGDTGVTIPYAALKGGKVDVFVDCRQAGYIAPDAAPEMTYEDDITNLPEDLREIFVECAAKDDELSRDICNMVKVAAERRRIPFDVENFRPMTPDKIEKIIEVYDDSVRVAAGKK